MDELGLRGRKKQAARRAISVAAYRLFLDRGFDDVTMTEIADAADVSTKTVFNYFGSKEDLFFQSFGEEDAFVAFLAVRPSGQPVFEALKVKFLELLNNPGIVNLDLMAEQLLGHLNVIESSRTLQARLPQLFERTEAALAKTLADETGADTSDPAPRVIAARIVSVHRFMFSPETRNYIESLPAEQRGQAMRDWMKKALDAAEMSAERYAPKR